MGRCGSSPFVGPSPVFVDREGLEPPIRSRDRHAQIRVVRLRSNLREGFAEGETDVGATGLEPVTPSL